jgi:integrase
LLAARENATSFFMVEWAGGTLLTLTRFHDVANRAGPPSVTLHILRHIAVTWMVQRGMPAWQVSGMAGTVPEMISEVHVHPASLSEVAKALNR